MENLTTPKAILFGLGLIALAIASVPYSSKLVKEAQANSIQRVQICGMVNVYGKNVLECAGLQSDFGKQNARLKVTNNTD